jgi:hypothetical protein
MQVTGIGINFGGCGSLGAAAGVPIAAGGIAPAGAAGCTSQAVSPAETLPPGMQALQQLLQDFTSAEILLMLMLMAGSRRKDDSAGGSGAALGLLAGFALGAQFGQQSQIGWSTSAPLDCASPVEAQFNVQA